MVVSVLHIGKGSVTERKRFDGRSVDHITAFLFHRGGDDDPVRLAANVRASFLGAKIYGQGFTFDDTDKKGLASPLHEMHRLIENDPRNQEVIFPYIGGQEVNTNPAHAHHRHVINFRDYPLRREGTVARDDRGFETARGAGENAAPRAASWAGATDAQRREWLKHGIVPLDYPGPVAADWPDMLAIVEQRVKPGRMRVNRKVRRDYWWRFGDRQPALYRAIAGLERVLAISRVGQYGSFTFLPPGTVYSEQLIVFPFTTFACFCALQARPHELWSRFFGSSMKDDLRYTPSDCFETFPFPSGWETNGTLSEAGQRYYDFRAGLMVRNNEGMTATYNRFHNPNENAPEIATLRSLHAAMDRAVLNAYGWRDIPTGCEFLLEHEIDEEERSARRRPCRYRWPDEVHDEVLARLLELNAERAVGEAGADRARGNVGG